ncbi:MAG: hypothetical protein EA353_14540, partial [Puniceicoccaceae bacterium]
FVIRSKSNTRFYVLESRPVDKIHGIDESLSRILQFLSVNEIMKVALLHQLGDLPEPKFAHRFC